MGLVNTIILLNRINKSSGINILRTSFLINHLSIFGLISYFVKIFHLSIPITNHFPLLEGAFDNNKYVLLKTCDSLKKLTLFLYSFRWLMFCSVTFIILKHVRKPRSLFLIVGTNVHNLRHHFQWRALFVFKIQIKAPVAPPGKTMIL